MPVLRRVFVLLLVLIVGGVGIERSLRVERIHVRVQAQEQVGRVLPIWDEINLWKLSAWFGIHAPDPADRWGEGWLRERVPWVRYARVVAPLGGNWGPDIADACAQATESEAHPDADWECGHDGQPGAAARNESVTWVDGAWATDYAPFRRALQRLLRSGVKPHLNLSAVPVAFTGGEGDFRSYHWNARAPVDLDGWLEFVRGAFRAISDLDTNGWRVSIINEPNCLLPDEHGIVQHVGFSGSPSEYARVWTATAQAIAEVAPGVVIHPGNYVTSATFAGEDNLHVYIEALAAEIRRPLLPAWQSLPYIGVSLYEVPGTRLDEFRSTRIHRLHEAQRRNALLPLPIKIDELGIHDNVRRPFDERSIQKTRTTRFAASWHAEAQRSFLVAGDVVSTSPWLDALYRSDLTALPPSEAYGMLGVLAGQLRTEASETGAIRFVESGNHDGLPRLETTVEPGEPDDGRPAPRPLATAGPDGTFRVFVVYHQPTIVTDGDPLQKRMAKMLTLEVQGAPKRGYAVRHTFLGGPDGASWNGAQLEPLRWSDESCIETNDHTLEIPGEYRMEANSIVLFELIPRPQCDTAPGTDSERLQPTRTNRDASFKLSRQIFPNRETMPSGGTDDFDAPVQGAPAFGRVRGSGRQIADSRGLKAFLGDPVVAL